MSMSLVCSVARAPLHPISVLPDLLTIYTPPLLLLRWSHDTPPDILPRLPFPCLPRTFDSRVSLGRGERAGHASLSDVGTDVSPEWPNRPYLRPYLMLRHSGRI